MLKGHHIICFANDWQADPLSKKHLMLRLAQYNRILWVNSLHNRRPRLARKDVRRIAQKLREFFRGVTNVHPNIWVVTPLYMPSLRYGWIRRANRWLLHVQLRRALWRLDFQRPITWTFVPTSADVVGTFGESLLVYHCVDEFAAFGDAAVSDVRLAEQRLLQKVDVVLAASFPLLECKRATNKHTYLVRHGVDYEHFRCATLASTPVAPELKHLPRPILGFHGLLADWVDIGALAEIARRRPDWTLVLVGRVETNVDALRTLPNVHLLGHQPYMRLPQILRGFDVALLPFVEGDLTYCANPLKLREYLAAGLPVVSSPLPEVVHFEPLVRTARTAAEFIRQIEDLMQRGQTGPSADRSDHVAGESWDRKVEEIEALLEPWLSPFPRRIGAPDVPANQ
jgi:glycosyltransferase involved in cell wall biosynthesis